MEALNLEFVHIKAEIPAGANIHIYINKYCAFALQNKCSIETMANGKVIFIDKKGRYIEVPEGFEIVKKN